MVLEKIALGVSWMPDGMAGALYVLAALLLVFMFVKIVLIVLEFIKGIADLIMFWKGRCFYGKSAACRQVPAGLGMGYILHQYPGSERPVLDHRHGCRGC